MQHRHRPILLWTPDQSITSDDAGTIILKYALPHTNITAPYELIQPIIYHYVPSLTYFVIKKLIEYPDQVNIGRVRLRYQPPSSPSSYDILRALIPDFDLNPDSTFSLDRVDPRLWAVLIQVYTNLPEVLRIYPIPLSDRHLPILQRVASTPEFSLITVLDLPGCSRLTDDTILELKVLNSLCAMDASATELSGYGIKRLSNSLGWSESEKRGPWSLRMLRLRNCKKVDNGVFTSLSNFPLLSVVDLRGTKCTPRHSALSEFRPSYKTELYHPTPILTSLTALSSAPTALFSSSNVFTLHITSLQYKPLLTVRRLRPAVEMQDAYVVIPPSGRAKQCSTIKAEPSHVGLPLSHKPSASRLKVGNSNVLAHRAKRQEELERHERNSLAFRERMERHAGWQGYGVEEWAMFGEIPFSGNSEESESENGNGGEDPYDEESSEEDLDDDDQDAECEEGDDDSDEDKESEDEENGIISEPDSSLTFPLSSYTNPIASVAATNFFNQVAMQEESQSTTSERGHQHVPTPMMHDAEADTCSLIDVRLITNCSPQREGRAPRSSEDHPTFNGAGGKPIDSTSPRGTPPSHSMTKRRRITDLAREANPKQRNLRHIDSVNDQSRILSSQPRSHITSASEGTEGHGFQTTIRPEVTRCPVTTLFSAQNSISSSERSPSRQITNSPQLRPSATYPLPIPPITSLDLSWQNTIAEAETRQHSDQQAASTFYYAPTNPCAQALRTTREVRRTGARDDLLMLYREPPEWCVLDAIREENLGSITQEREPDIAVINRADEVGRGGIRALNEAIAMRRTMSALPSRGMHSPSIPITASTNPFRRNTEPAKQNHEVSQNVAKRLVPISTLRVTPLPQEPDQNIRKSSMRFRPTSPKISLMTMGAQKATSGNASKFSAAKSSFRHRESTNGFDWKAWCKK